jgi:hypothetical protein
MRHLPCPETEKICRDVVFFEQNLLLAKPLRMAEIGGAVTKLRRNAREITKIEVKKDAFMGSAVLRQAAKNAGA